MFYFIWRNVGPAMRVTLPSQMGDPLGGSTLQPRELFASVLNGSPIFARKCRKRWFAQSSLGRRVCLLPMTTFLHINALHGVYVVVPVHHTSAESLNSSSSPSPGGLFFITS